MKFFTPAFRDGELIPAKYTCDGDDVSPPLQWSDLPEGTGSLALIVDDPDAPRGTFVHWLMWDIDPAENGLTERVGVESGSAAGARQGRNGFGKVGYGGPCPPSGVHRYFFRLYALDRMIGLPAGATGQQFKNGIEGRVLAQADFMGRYERGSREMPRQS